MIYPQYMITGMFGMVRTHPVWKLHSKYQFDNVDCHYDISSVIYDYESLISTLKRLDSADVVIDCPSYGSYSHISDIYYDVIRISDTQFKIRITISK